MNVILRGGANDDRLEGGSGNDRINGGAGRDTLVVSANNNITLTDAEVTGEGTDSFINVELANLNGGNSSNLINASSTTNINTVINGNSGNDTLRGGAKADELHGGENNDTLIGFAGNDTIDGGAGSDRLYVAVDNDITLTDTQVTGDGTDTISNIEFANLYGREGNNRIDARNATKISTVIKGEGGNDNLRGGQKNDTIQGGEGNDTLIGFEGNDVINGGSGSDRLYVTTDNRITLSDTQVTGDGTDRFSNVEFANLYGRAGDNYIDARNASKVRATIRGENGNDTLRGGQNKNTIVGGNGDDVLFGEGGNDTISGNGGSDRLYVIADNDITLTNNRVTGDGTDSFSNIEFANLYGGDGNNYIDARSAANISTVIRGYGGDDNLRGGMKNDTILGRFEYY